MKSRCDFALSVARRARAVGLAAAAVFMTSCATQTPDTAWPVYGGGAEGQRYSTLGQINAFNVADLSEVWRWEAGPGGLQTSPLMVDGTLFGYTPTQSVVALDAATGALRWRFEPGSRGQQPARGFAYWREGGDARLFAGAMNELIALDPRTGLPIAGFGRKGRVDLREGLSRSVDTLPVYLTTPGVVYGDTIIVGFRTVETPGAAPGAIRAYDVRTGALRWTFRLTPQSGELGSETWPAGYLASAGGANAWAGFALDEARGIVYAPTGSATYDPYGADRIGDNLFANSLVALDAKTGQRIWHYQIVRHDIWDRDLPSPPVLMTLHRKGKAVDAVAQTTKHGYVYVFDRLTGEPLFPIRETPVPASTVPGEKLATHQPVPTAPAPFARQHLTRDELTDRTPAARRAALAEFDKIENSGLFTPYVVGRQSVVFPGYNGGAEWGGSAVDPATGVLFINANDVAATGGLADASPAARGETGRIVYESQCAACHGLDRKGAPPSIPSLLDYSTESHLGEINQALDGGKGRMPAFPYIRGVSREALIAYLFGRAQPENESVGAGPRYVFTGYRDFLDPDGYPAVKPPWGTLSAIDLNTGRYRWRIALGNYPELAAQGLGNTGTQNYGGPLLTRGGLVFIGATIWDRAFRAFDARNGRLLWQAELPYAGVATPITYAIGGVQYVVIAASGARDRAGPQGSAYVAFALR